MVDLAVEGSKIVAVPLAGGSGEARLGDYLHSKGLLSDVQLDYALQKQVVEEEKLGSLLIRHGLVTEHDVALVLSDQRGIPYADLEQLPVPDHGLLGHFNRQLCLGLGFLPLTQKRGELQVLVGDAELEDVRQQVMRRTGLKADFIQSTFTQVREWIRQSFFFAEHPIESLIRREINLLADDVDNAYSPERLLELMLHLAIRERATDIHLAPGPKSLHALFRVDGVLRPMLAIPSSLGRLLSFIKLTAEMDIAEQRRPQDGSFQAVILDADYAVRVSTLISDQGERMVLRLLPQRNELASLEQLGFREKDVKRLQRVFAKPSGMLLITGPTGSGKSTTLHAALRQQSVIERNVITIEDPIEYHIAGACQTEVNRRAGYDFNNALPNFLRHDPDVILLGEIRDAETARSALDASATGHLLLSSLHVTSIFGIVPRLRPMGLEPQMIADNLIAVINQRLVRQSCPHCVQAQEPTDTEQTWLGEDYAGIRILRGQGCGRCGNTGYLGRLPLYEILTVNEAIANAIADDVGRARMRQVALERASFTSLLDLGRWRVAEGQTTPEEIERITGEGPGGEP